MANSFDVNRAVALSHVQTEQMKGWFLSKARILVILLSGAMLFLGVLMLFGNLRFALTLQFLFDVLAVLPVAAVAGLLAIIIEGGTVFAGNYLREALDTAQKEQDALRKVAHKFNAEEVSARKKQIQKQTTVPYILLFVCIGFSTVGAEIFWQQIMENREWWYHILGGILGLVCSALLVVFELKADMIERIVEKSISSSALIQMALDQSAKAQIYDNVFNEQRRMLNTAEVKESIGMAVHNRLHGVLADTVSIGGVSVTAEQLKREIKRVREERSAAEHFLTTKDENVLQIAQNTQKEPVVIERKSKNRKAVESAVAKYGFTRLASDIDKYADDLNMDARTLQKHLTDIGNAG